MGPFLNSYNHQYILVCVDYVTKWVEVVASPYNDTQTLVDFLKKNIFSKFGVPWILLSNGGTHFRNRVLAKLLAKYNVKNKVITRSHPQTSAQVKVSNRHIKQIF